MELIRTKPMRWLIIVFAWVLLLSVAGAAEQFPPAESGSFSIVALPDTQQYSEQYPETFYAETQWVLDNLQSQRIVFVTHLGDIVQKDWRPDQWAVAVRAMSKLDGKVPYGLSVGNHDMNQPEGDAPLFSAMFPTSHFAKRPWYGGQIRNNVDSYQLFEAEGLKFLVLHLECNAPDTVLRWADGVLKANMDRRVIVTTHMFLGPAERPKTKQGYRNDPKGIMQWKKCHGEAGNTPQQLWDKCFSKHKNIFLILSGDQSRTQSMQMALEGVHGNKVRACVTDYRDGYFRVYRFLPKKNLIRAITYSATSEQLCRGTDTVKEESKHQFTFAYDMTVTSK